MHKTLLLISGQKPWRIFSREEYEGRDLATEISTLLGQPATVSNLRSFKENEARENSLSSRYGLNGFPLHTDFAALTNPPRYLLLLAPYPRETKTLLSDSIQLVNKFGMQDLQCCSFMLASPIPHYCRLLAGEDPNLIFRFNGDLMCPKNTIAKTVSAYIKTEMIAEATIDWKINCGAIIDNWRALHGREAVSVMNDTSLKRFAFHPELE